MEIEQLRFEDALTVRYDIGCTDFNMPALTLEPLVENAIRHGVRIREDGEVRVESFREDGGHVTIDSKPGDGTVVTVRIPMETDKAQREARGVGAGVNRR